MVHTHTLTHTCILYTSPLLSSEAGSGKLKKGASCHPPKESALSDIDQSPFHGLFEFILDVKQKISRAKGRRFASWRLNNPTVALWVPWVCLCFGEETNKRKSSSHRFLLGLQRQIFFPSYIFVCYFVFFLGGGVF